MHIDRYLVNLTASIKRIFFLSIKYAMTIVADRLTPIRQCTRIFPERQNKNEFLEDFSEKMSKGNAYHWILKLCQ